MTFNPLNRLAASRRVPHAGAGPALPGTGCVSSDFAASLREPTVHRAYRTQLSGSDPASFGGRRSPTTARPGA